jgi:hypothetical protein
MTSFLYEQNANKQMLVHWLWPWIVIKIIGCGGDAGGPLLAQRMSVFDASSFVFPMDGEQTSDLLAYRYA